MTGFGRRARVRPASRWRSTGAWPIPPRWTARRTRPARLPRHRGRAVPPHALPPGGPGQDARRRRCV